MEFPQTMYVLREHTNNITQPSNAFSDDCHLFLYAIQQQQQKNV